MKEKGFMKISRRYLAETIKDADDADDQAVLEYTLVQAESWIHSLE